MLQLIIELRRNRELIWALALKEIRVRYKRSALGFLWALLNPLFMMIILTVVFSSVMHSAIRDYAVFLICALMPWTFFSQAVAYAADSMITNSDLLRKVQVDKSVFPVAAVLSNVINFVFSLVTLILILVLLRFPFHWTWVYLPVPFAALILFALGCGFFLAMANVFLRDVSQTLQVILAAWFYVSPVIYNLDFIPERFRFYFRLNPMMYILDSFRVAIYYGQLPSLGNLAMTVGSGVVALTIGYSLFRRYQDKLVFYV
jgi:ABC-type polysaccharide/polyol phosphate export permease